VDDIGVGPRYKVSNARKHRSVDLPVARNQMRLDSFFGGCFMQLQIWVGGVRKYTERARMRALIQSARHVQDDGLCAIHPAATDDVQNLHLLQFPPLRYLVLFD
jgi:hypothetical protein